jgi:hypothetical protein
MSGGIDDINNETSHKLLTEIVERNKGRACFELFGVLPDKFVGTVKRTFLYKSRKFLVVLKDMTNGD